MSTDPTPEMNRPATDPDQSLVLAVAPLGFPWQTVDPFLFCVHHDDAYPVGNEEMGPAASLAGRDLGQDFAGKDGWRMYHGEVVPGFPQHPHRGFETVTVARKGFIDHADSLGATARFGSGDVQWMTAGRGIVHAEMFPLRERESNNPLELFQIWLNLPSADKMVEPHFTMLWRHTIPIVSVDDGEKRSEVTVLAGGFGDAVAPPPPPKSWAARPDTHVAIWTIRMDAHAALTLPAAPVDVVRTVYLFRGEGVSVSGGAPTQSKTIDNQHCFVVRSDVPTTVTNGGVPAELLVLQGKPIGEPVAHHGPFVMNTKAELQQAMVDYQQTRFGGWPWPVSGPVHPRHQGRFAKHADGKQESLE